MRSLSAALVGLLLAGAFLLAASGAFAAPSPASGTISPSSSPIAFTGNIVAGANPTSIESLCQEDVTCESFVLSVSGQPADWAGKLVRVRLTWTTAAEEYDIYVHKDTLNGPIVASYAVGSTNDEHVDLDPTDPTVGTGIFIVHVSGAIAAAADEYKGTISVQLPQPKPAPAVAATGIAPSFQIHNPPPGFGADSGEPSIGVNPLSGAIFYLSDLQTLKATADDSCRNTPALSWTDVSAPTTSKEGLDPILFTDARTGRTIVSQLTGADSLSAYTDDDGKTWIPTQGGGIPSGIDHQSVGGGPFHAPLPSGAVYSDIVYYCTQADADANCAASLDGGLTFGPAVVIYNLTQCGGLHGHIKVGPDGTAYVPNDNCPGVGGGQGVAVSEDNGITWTVRGITGSSPGTSDPSVAIDRGGRLYVGMANGDSAAVVAISDDHGQTWTKLVDVGAPLGVHAVEFAEMTAGDAGRAAFMFLGSTANANPQSLGFPGVWHLYVATTYDGGATWFTQDATPNDAVQRHGIWNGGGAVVFRNLLDFNDLTVDGKGNLVAAFADGCFDAACAQATGVGNGYTARVSILRQVAGRSLFGANDPPAGTVVAPGAPQLKVLRNGALAYLSWNQSSSGGAPIGSYSIYRASGGGSAAQIGTASGSATSFVDDTVDPAASYTYSVTATNSAGTSCGSNAVSSAPAGGSCLPGGETVGAFAPGLQTGAPANPWADIRSISVGEPAFNDGVERFVVTMKVADLSSLPPDATWRVQWATPSSPSAYWYLGMNSDAQGHVTYEYGTYGVTSVVVTGVGQYSPIGAPDQGSFTPDGTITWTVRKDVVGSAKAGDLLGQMTGKAYLLSGNVPAGASREPLDTAIGGNYLVMGNLFCAPPTTSTIEDDDARIAYSSGWHQVTDGAASAGHFHYGEDNGGATLSFGVPAGQYGSLAFHYGRAAKGGTGEVFLDGVSQGIVDFGNGSGSSRAPALGFSQTYSGLKPGAHTFQLVRRAKGAINVDGFALKSSYSNAQPAAHPGQTATAANAAAAPGGNSQLAYTAPAGAQSLSLLASSSMPVPLALVALDLAGHTVGTAQGTGSVALELTAPAGTKLILQAVNASTGLADVTLTATPNLAR